MLQAKYCGSQVYLVRAPTNVSFNVVKLLLIMKNFIVHMIRRNMDMQQ
jgi:hypothetical protein